MSNELLLKMRNVKKLFKKAKTGGIVYVLHYKLEKKAYKIELARAKDKVLEQELKEAESNYSKIWRILNEKCGLKNRQITTFRSRSIINCVRILLWQPKSLAISTNRKLEG